MFNIIEGKKGVVRADYVLTKLKIMNAILFNTDYASVNTAEILKEAEKIINSAQKGKKSNHNKSIIVIIFVIIFIIALTIFSTIFSLLNLNSNTIISGVSIMGIDVSGLTEDEAIQKVNDSLDERLNTNLVFSYNEQYYNILPTQLECSFNVTDAVSEAYTAGRTGNIFENNFSILNTLIQKVDITPEFLYNDDLCNSIIDQMNSTLEGGLTQASYEIDGSNLVITAGTAGKVIVSSELKDLITEKMLATNYTTDSIELPVETEEADDIDVEAIHEEIYKEAQDAYYTTDPFAVYASETGLDFDITIEEAKALITGDSTTYTIPLKTLYPTVTTADLGMEAFPDLLASYSTSYSTSSSNRCTNIALAASKINGTVLMPGESFSFNSTVGKRTAQAGFKIAGVYSDGQVTSDYGGGICQVSSTLYNAVLRANLNVTYRTNHTFMVSYVPIGLDATVSWGSPDFTFTNNRNYPVKIVATTSNKKVYISIYGYKEETEYEVEIISYKTSTIAYSTVYTTDSSLATGQTKVVQSGSNGATSVTYKILKLNGVEVSRELVSKDTYSPHNQIIAQGTG